MLGLEHETAALVQVNEPGTGFAVAVLERDRPLEDVGILAVVGRCRIGVGDVDQIAQLGNEKLVVGAFCRARAFPAFDKGRSRL
jgi:hypothetical protein